MVSTNQQQSGLAEQIITDLVDPLADLLAAKYYSDAPPNLLVPEKVWKETKRNEIREELRGGEMQDKIRTGKDIFFNYVRTQLSPDEKDRIFKEWTDGSAAYGEYFAKNKPAPMTMEMLENPPEEDPNATQPDMEQIMGISQATIDHLYNAGTKQFQERLYKEASYVFTVLLMLNYRRHNVWISLGMSLQYNQEIESALKAYNMAIVTDPEDPLSYIHSAECCIQDRQLDQAKTFLDQAAEVAPKAIDTYGDLTGYINQLKGNCN